MTCNGRIVMCDGRIARRNGKVAMHNGKTTMRYARATTIGWQGATTMRHDSKQNTITAWRESKQGTRVNKA